MADFYNSRDPILISISIRPAFLGTQIPSRACTFPRPRIQYESFIEGGREIAHASRVCGAGCNQAQKFRLAFAFKCVSDDRLGTNLTALSVERHQLATALSVERHQFATGGPVERHSARQAGPLHGGIGTWPLSQSETRSPLPPIDGSSRQPRRIRLSNISAFFLLANKNKFILTRTNRWQRATRHLPSAHLWYCRASVRELGRHSVPSLMTY
ncbi:unnamed protein product [Nesidiocoris tenuis]|uniref:Uncharacterized protein n=1 Tax=Nesidiocoris tenuis TaxID=355587 RepID=A0A6H5H478_9HEMI|nr:unnamed protein product [Nesidiocoris tenuis]